MNDVFQLCMWTCEIYIICLCIFVWYSNNCCLRIIRPKCTLCSQLFIAVMNIQLTKSSSLTSCYPQLVLNVCLLLWPQLEESASYKEFSETSKKNYLSFTGLMWKLRVSDIPLERVTLYMCKKYIHMLRSVLNKIVIIILHEKKANILRYHGEIVFAINYYRILMSWKYSSENEVNIWISWLLFIVNKIPNYEK